MTQKVRFGHMLIIKAFHDFFFDLTKRKTAYSHQLQTAGNQIFRTVQIIFEMHVFRETGRMVLIILERFK